ncbi:aspartyl-phosphate phosphatase Spo0E family protein [Clostridium sp. MB40-C1]|uniref:aspartyl-phosphate phosphatase Spo0E family protein n=1 Tax=Clostridium sp. MB40-C1 TaxID=3070996 RepID=UPI0027DF278C|nr:aspartyl-phosphate phosphatase Spo0E family protein [Clostridium sp. MB40-C1]WMJ79398.1 aspartyl-phosphate phosphatase Spo0E family protein [Clostridium sp. MB40-C1]
MKEYKREEVDKIKEDIFFLKQQMYELIQEKPSMLDNELIQISEELDILINIYYFFSKDTIEK